MALLSSNFESFGLDVGDRSLKAIFIRKKGTSLAIESHCTVPVQIGVLEQGEIKKPDELAAAIKKIFSTVQGKKLNTRFAHICLPETKTFIKRISINPAKPHELPAYVRDELPNHIPIEPDDLYIDWKILETDAQKRITSVLVGAIPKAVSDMYTSVLLSAGVKPMSLQVEAESILRSLLPLNQSTGEALAILDIGAARSSFICFDKGSIQFSVTMPFSGDGLTQEIAKKLQLSGDEAEKAKRICGLDPNECKGEMIDVIKPTILELAHTIKRNNGFYEEHFSGAHKIKTLVVCGGGAYLKHFNETLAEVLPDLKIYTGNPLVNVARSRNRIISKNENGVTFDFLEAGHPREDYNIPSSLLMRNTLNYTTAIGLALANIT